MKKNIPHIDSVRSALNNLESELGNKRNIKKKKFKCEIRYMEN